MATQNYRSRSDQTVGENSGTSRPVHPARLELDPKPGMENRTPAPIRVAPDLTKDQAWGRASGNPGANAYGGPISLSPGQRAAPAAVNAQASTDTVLQGLIEGRTARLDERDNWQTRPVSADQAVPTTFGHRSRVADSNEAKVPAKCGASVATPLRLPDGS